MSWISALPLWQLLLIGYLATGAVIMNIPRARKEISSVLSPEDAESQPLWKVVFFFGVLLLVSLLLWPLLVKDWLNPPRSLMDELKSNEGYQAMLEINKAMAEMARDGCETDELPDAYGEYGYDISNPIPTEAVSGSIRYLGRLNAPDGSKVRYQRIGCYGCPVSKNLVDGYELSHQDGTALGTIYVSPYQTRNSEKAPAGLTLISGEEKAAELLARLKEMDEGK